MAQYIVVSLVVLIILSFPLLFNLFGKQDKCGRTLWDKIKSRFKK